MKTFWNLTGRERLALTKEQIETIYVPREAAEAGLLVPREPILEPLPPEPDVEKPKGRNVFIVNVRTEDSGSNTINVAFDTQKQAEAFIALNPMYYTSRWRRNKSMNTATPCESIELQIVCVTTEKEEDAYAKAREEYESALGRNADKTNAYERELQKVKNSAERIWKNWNKLRERESYLRQLRETLDEFIKVAEGNLNMAIKFMMKNVQHQAIYDMLNEFGEADWQWDGDMFGGCMAQDANPYRDIEDPSKNGMFG